MNLEQWLSHTQQNIQHNCFDFGTALHELIGLSSAVALPGSGQTYDRWQFLAQVAALHLGLAKCLESHLDARAILAELGHESSETALYAVWAAEGPQATLNYTAGKVTGAKPWCSGAKWVDYGLMTYRDQANQSCLVLVDLHQEGILQDASQWHAVGMQSTQTLRLEFDHVLAKPIATDNLYLERTGFWHGAAGVAACWYGAAAGLTEYLKSSALARQTPFKLYYLGQALSQMQLMRENFYALARQIDQAPEHSHEFKIRSLRAEVERLCREVLNLVGQALGAAPFCQDAVFAQLAADLPVFIRQSHGAFDFEQIAQMALLEPVTCNL